LRELSANKTILSGTLHRLYAWGRWGGQIHLGYPNCSAGFTEHTGKLPVWTKENPDPDILQTDKAVSAIEPEFKILIIGRYQWRTHWADIARRNGWSKATYFRKLENAHWAVHTFLGH
jgi:hypothetical protein